MDTVGVGLNTAKYQATLKTGRSISIQTGWKSGLTGAMKPHMINS